MKIDKLQQKIFYFLLFLCLLTPVGILLPMFFNAGDAWGEWSAQTVKDMIGYIPQGLAKYDTIWKAPLPDYTITEHDSSVVRQSGFYMVSGIFGATICFAVMLLISRLIIKNGK
jgi:cobalt/nickel transport protein